MITIIFCAFDWQENLWGMNFHGHGSLVGTIVVGFAKYSSYCKLIFVDKRHTMKSRKHLHFKKLLASTSYNALNYNYCNKA